MLFTSRAESGRCGSGVAEGFSQLLEAAGVDTVKELAHRNAENLTAKIAEVNEQLKLTGRVPTLPTPTTLRAPST